jgi:hypothetical protein
MSIRKYYIIADIRYHNYALTQENIRTLFNKKYNKDWFKTALQIKNKSLIGSSDIGQINSLKSVLYNWFKSITSILCIRDVFN